jgi:hypothetical protein
LLLVFSACLDIEQTLTVNEDLSGTLEVRYIFDEEALELQEFIDPEEELFTEAELVGMIDTAVVSLSSFSETRKNGLRIVDMVYAFKDINKLGTRWCDDHNFISLDQSDVHSVLTWSYAAAEEPKEDPDAVMNELEELFSDHYCTFTVKAPHKITQVDESATLSQDLRTAQWRFPMLSFMKGDTLNIRVQFQKPTSDSLHPHTD